MIGGLLRRAWLAVRPEPVAQLWALGYGPELAAVGNDLAVLAGRWRARHGVRGGLDATVHDAVHELLGAPPTLGGEQRVLTFQRQHRVWGDEPAVAFFLWALEPIFRRCPPHLQNQTLRDVGEVRAWVRIAKRRRS